MQRNKQVAMGRKKFNMDPKKVLWGAGLVTRLWGSAQLYHLPGQVAGTEAEPAARAGTSGQGAGWWGQPRTPKHPSCTPPGHPVPDRERPAEEHVRGHCSVPVQGRGPQQDSHRRLPGREVHWAWVSWGCSGLLPPERWDTADLSSQGSSLRVPRVLGVFSSWLALASG